MTRVFHKVPEDGYVIAVDGANATWQRGAALVVDDSLVRVASSSNCRFGTRGRFLHALGLGPSRQVHEVFAPPAAGVPSMRVILIVDIHHPDLTREERLRVRPLGPAQRSQ